MRSDQISIQRYPALSEKYDNPHLTNWLSIEAAGWRLIGSQSAYSDCGAWRYRGCLNVAAHAINRLDNVKVSGKVYVQRFRRNCLRSKCMVCYEAWVGREAKRAEKRFTTYLTKSKAIHVVISPKEYKNFDLMKKEARKLLKKAGIFGGMMIFHPFRQDKEGIWYFSPHFHILGYGWISQSKEIFEETGWIIKNLGVRKSIRSTIFYQLSHSGQRGDNHGVTWFGVMSYNKLKVVEEEEVEHLCPICEGHLEMLSPLSDIGSSLVVRWTEDEAFSDPFFWKALKQSY